MKKSQQLILLPLILISLLACMEANKKPIVYSPIEIQEGLSLSDISLKKVVKSDIEWKKTLTTNQYNILRHQATETPFNNAYHDNHAKGNYFCAGCKLPLFNSSTKFNSGTGWPSFYAPIQKNRVKEVVDKQYGIVRGEIVCARCEGHLGHVFDDGPNPSGLRYCINSGSLLFLISK